MSMSNASWVHQQYNELVKKYGGRCILVREQQVVFSDISFDTVFDYAEKTYPDGNWEIRRIDDGEAAIYYIKLSNQEDRF